MENNQQFTWNENPTFEWESIPSDSNQDTISFPQEDEQTHQEDNSFPIPSWNSPEEKPTFNFNDQSSQNQTVTPPVIPEEINRNLNSYTFLGFLKKIDLGAECYRLHHDIDKILIDINNSNLTPIHNEKNKFDFSPQPNTELGNLINTLVSIGKSKNIKISSCNVCKTNNDDNSYNIANPNTEFSFVYAAKITPGFDFINLDFAPLGGPVIKAFPLSEGNLLIYPGWIPSSVFKQTTDESIIITGNFSKP